MNDLVVNNQFSPSIIDDQSPHTATPIRKRPVNLVVQATLINDRQTLLDIPTLRHADQAAILTHIQDAILLEDRAQHALHHDRVTGVADKGALLVELAGEEVHTEESQLARLRRGRYADHLARAALQDDQVTNADEVARDGDGVGGESSTRLDEADRLTNSVAHAGGAGLVARHHHLLFPTVVVVGMMAEGVEDAIGGAFDTAAKAVVLAFVVVVTHVVSGGSVSDVNFFLGNFNVLASGLATVVDFVGWVDAAAVFALCDVDLGFVGLIPNVVAVGLDVESALFCGTGVADDTVSPGDRKKQKECGRVSPFACKFYFRILVLTSIVARTEGQPGLHRRRPRQKDSIYLERLKEGL